MLRRRRNQKFTVYKYGSNENSLRSSARKSNEHEVVNQLLSIIDNINSPEQAYPDSNP